MLDRDEGPGNAPVPELVPAVTPGGTPIEPAPRVPAVDGRNEWRGTLSEAIRQSSERSGVAGFASADWASQSTLRVMKPEELTATIERAHGQFAPGVEQPRAYTVGQDGTIYNTVTNRAEYVPVGTAVLARTLDPAQDTVPIARPLQPTRGSAAPADRPPPSRGGQTIAELALQARNDPRVGAIMAQRWEEVPSLDGVPIVTFARPSPNVPQTDKAWAAAAIAVRARDANPNAAFIPAPESLIGTPEYYVFRWAAAPAAYRDQTGPEYLLDFGYANINRFNALAASDGASKPLKDFVANTGVALQRNLERSLAADPCIASSRSMLLDVAYESHTASYASGGFGTLTLQDQARVAWTPPLHDSFLNGKAYPVFWKSKGMLNPFKF